MRNLDYDDVTQVINMLRSNDFEVKILALSILGNDPAVVSEFDAKRLANEMRMAHTKSSFNNTDYKSWLSDFRCIYGRLITYHKLNKLEDYNTYYY